MCVHYLVYGGDENIVADVICLASSVRLQFMMKKLIQLSFMRKLALKGVATLFLLDHLTMSRCNHNKVCLKDGGR